MRFDSPEEYYETPGYLSKSDDSIDLVWENNEDQKLGEVKEEFIAILI